jgi:hypothetical protein
MVFKKLEYPVLALSLLLFVSCISTNKLKDLPPDVVNGLPFDSISGNYVNSDCDSGISKLWTKLYSSHSFKRDTTKITEDTYINLGFIDSTTLRVQAIEENVVLNSFELYGKLSENYFSVDRKILFLPFPFIYFRHSERKILLGVGNDGNLVVKYGAVESLWIFIMAGGYEGITAYEYEKLRGVKEPNF